MNSDTIFLWVQYLKFGSLRKIDKRKMSKYFGIFVLILSGVICLSGKNKNKIHEKLY